MHQRPFLALVSLASLTLLAFGLLALFHLPDTSLAEGPVLVEDFNDNSIDPATWTTAIVGTGPSIAETNQRLEVTLPGNSTPEFYLGQDRFSAGYWSVCKLRGDFDVQVDYQFLSWPSNSGIRTGIWLREFGATQRDDLPPESYLVDFPTVGGTLQWVATSDLSGKLRTTRTGTTLRGFYYSHGTSDWVEIGSTTAPGAGIDTPFILNVWAHYQFSGQAKVAFDNFIVSQGQVICPAGSSSTPTATPTLTPTATATATPTAIRVFMPVVLRGYTGGW